MAKGIGLIGNFKGKVGNMVGYKLSDSNTGNTQGIRVYQPIVRNPKTSAQAEQRAKLAPINATYRALKMIIDRGNEGLPYGNKSRLAWLKQAFKATGMPWFIKGASIGSPVLCQLTKGSLSGLQYHTDGDVLTINVQGVTTETAVATIGNVSKALLDNVSWLRDGDQITIVSMKNENNSLQAVVESFVLDATSAVATENFEAAADQILYTGSISPEFVAVIVSREGANGEHLRTTAYLVTSDAIAAAAPYDADSKAAAIESYQNAASANADWAEESIQ